MGMENDICSVGTTDVISIIINCHKTSKMNQANQTPLEDLRKDALAHHDD